MEQYAAFALQYLVSDPRQFALLLILVALVLTYPRMADVKSAVWRLHWPGAPTFIGLVGSALALDTRVITLGLPPFSTSSRLQLMFPILGIAIGVELVRRWRDGRLEGQRGIWLLAVVTALGSLVLANLPQVLTAVLHCAIGVSLQLSALAIQPAWMKPNQVPGMYSLPATLLLAAAAQLLLQR